MDKIRKKIKELRELSEDHNYYLDNSEQALGYGAALDDIEKFLDTLEPKEPDKSLEEDLEKEMDSYFKKWWMDLTDQGYILRTPDGTAGLISVKNIARHFAEWQKEQDNNFERFKDYTDKALISLEEAREQGRQEMKQQMLKGAVEGEVHPDDCEIWVNLVGYGYKFNDGDKVRILVLKAEEE